MVKNNKYIGKKIMVGEPLYSFVTDELIGWTRRRYMGIIESMTDTEVIIYNYKNPTGYRQFSIKKSDFDKWVVEKLYIIKNLTFKDTVFTKNIY